ncbi:MAG: hypothetical protein AB2375_07445 [Tissierellaceae bacterium]
MKKIAYIIGMVIIILSMSACSKTKDITYMGVNAEILEISGELNGFVVKGLDDDSILGEKCYINCEAPDIYFVYVDNDTEEVSDLKFDDFIVGDKITVDIKSVENKYALASRIQLLTQRR